MQLRYPALILAGLCLLSSLKAQVVLTFEGLQDNESILQAYNGGTGSGGSSLFNYGVSFSGNALALIDSDAGGTGNFSNEPSPSTILYFVSGSSTIMNVSAGFNSQLSFNYASSINGSVSIYDGLNGTGNLLAVLSLPATPFGSGDPTGSFDLNYIASTMFSGTAYSVNFAGTENQIGFDDITLGLRDQQPPVTPVPEPSTYGLMGAAALAGLGCFRRLRRRAA